MDKRLKLGLGTFFFIALLYDILSDSITEILNIGYTVGMLIVIASILIYLYQMIIQTSYQALYQIPLFWMAIGILLFYSSLFPLLLFVNKLLAIDAAFTAQLFKIVSIGNIFLTLGYLGAVVCQLNIKK